MLFNALSTARFVPVCNTPPGRWLLGRSAMCVNTRSSFSQEQRTIERASERRYAIVKGRCCSNVVGEERSRIRRTRFGPSPRCVRHLIAISRRALMVTIITKMYPREEQSRAPEAVAKGETIPKSEDYAGVPLNGDTVDVQTSFPHTARGNVKVGRRRGSFAMTYPSAFGGRLNCDTS